MPARPLAGNATIVAESEVPWQPGALGARRHEGIVSPSHQPLVSHALHRAQGQAAKPPRCPPMRSSSRRVLFPCGITLLCPEPFLVTAGVVSRAEMRAKRGNRAPLGWRRGPFHAAEHHPNSSVSELSQFTIRADQGEIFATARVGGTVGPWGECGEARAGRASGAMQTRISGSSPGWVAAAGDDEKARATTGAEKCGSSC